MNIYSPSDNGFSGSYGRAHKPYIPKRLKEAGIDMKWIKDPKNLFGGYWQFYNTKECKA